MAYYSENTTKVNNMTAEDEEHYRNTKFCTFCEMETFFNKIRDHCHFTSKYRGVAHQSCIMIVTQKRRNFTEYKFYKFSNFDCQLCFKKLVDKKNEKIKFDMIPKANEKFISVTFGCIRFNDSNRFLSSSLDLLVKTLVYNVFEILKKEFPDKWEYLKKISIPL